METSIDKKRAIRSVLIISALGFLSLGSMYQTPKIETPRASAPVVVEPAITKARILTFIKREARLFKLNPATLYGIVMQESGFKVEATNRSGDLGLMQLSEDFRKRYNSSKAWALNPKFNIEDGAWFYRKMLDSQKQNETMALREYHCGLPRLKREPDCGIDYERNVQKFKREFKKKG